MRIMRMCRRSQVKEVRVQIESMRVMVGESNHQV